MDKKEVLRQVVEMVNDGEFERFTPAELGGILIEVLTKFYDELPEKAVGPLFLVTASLMRDHCEAVEKDIFAVRDIYQRHKPT